MMNFLRDINKRAFLGGVLSYIPGLYAWWDRRRPTGNAFSSEYSKSIWNFHFDNYQRLLGSKVIPKVVAEFGTGASLGSLIAAIKDDVKFVIGLDLVPYADNFKLNKKILDEIIPPKKHPDLNNKISLEIAQISNPKSTSKIKYLAPWDKNNLVPSEYIDFIFSHSVLEHVDQIEHAYSQMYRILKKGGIMSHKIDHSSHKITNSWNGHYKIKDLFWRIIRGRKPYLLNRLTPSEHKSLLISSNVLF